MKQTSITLLFTVLVAFAACTNASGMLNLPDTQHIANRFYEFLHATTKNTQGMNENIMAKWQEWFNPTLWQRLFKNEKWEDNMEKMFDSLGIKSWYLSKKGDFPLKQYYELVKEVYVNRNKFDWTVFVTLLNPKVLGLGERKISEITPDLLKQNLDALVELVVNSTRVMQSVKLDILRRLNEKPIDEIMSCFERLGVTDYEKEGRLEPLLTTVSRLNGLQPWALESMLMMSDMGSGTRNMAKKTGRYAAEMTESMKQQQGRFVDSVMENKGKFFMAAGLIAALSTGGALFILRRQGGSVMHMHQGGGGGRMSASGGSVGAGAKPIKSQ